MPELPEVETIARGLDARLAGRRVREVLLNRAGLRVAFPPDLHDILSGARILRVHRRAKYLLFDLDNARTVLAHLGMSGTMLVRPCDAYEPRKHDHMLWGLDDDHWLIFNDPRRFGFVLHHPTARLAGHPRLAGLGAEPLSDGFSAGYLADSLSACRSALKVALMDQKRVVGIGNIYACEALFQAELSPFMPASEASGRADALIAAIRAVLRAALASGGSTLRDYVRSDGQGGYFQHDFAVYGRAQQPCPRCAQPVSQRRLSGRSTFFCAACQKVN